MLAISTSIAPDTITQHSKGSSPKIQSDFAAADIAPQIAIGTVTSIGMPVSSAAGVYNPITVGEATATLGGTAEGAAAVSAAELLLGAKIGLDGLVYLESLVVCGIN